MDFADQKQTGFLYEMMETMVTATEIFNRSLLNNLDKYFGLKKTFITIFDLAGNFLSLTDQNRLHMGQEHPYANVARNDICARKINEECRRNKLWYDNDTPYIYRSTDLLAQEDTETSEYISFLRNVMHAAYMVIMPFDIDGCIHLCIYRGEDETDFSDSELKQFEAVYQYIARTLRSFKTLEKPRIVSQIKDDIISAQENAYLVLDLNHKILTANQRAIEYLSTALKKHLSVENLQEVEPFLSFMLLGEDDQNRVKTTTINGFAFQIHPFPMSYVHGVVEIYHWISISKAKDVRKPRHSILTVTPLTRREEKVAELLCEGLTYQAIADQLHISFHTVKNHAQNIFAKYGVNGRYQFYQVYKGGK